jgi:hypothetical protein
MTSFEAGAAGARAANLLQIGLVFLVGFVVVFTGWSIVGDGFFIRQAVVWVANAAMLLSIWIGLRIRGQGWEYIGLSFRFGGVGDLAWAVARSIVVLIGAVVAFVAGSVVMTAFAAAPASADTSGYEYLQGNLPMLLLALTLIYPVSSFGEEVVYRGFLMTRIAETGHSTRMAWGVAVAISAIVFGLAHFGWGIVGIVQTTFMGVALGAAYLWVKRRLWVLILAHAYMDTLLLVQVYLAPSSSG